MKRKYIIPSSELIQIKPEGTILLGSRYTLKDNANNYLQHKPTQGEIVNGKDLGAPFTRGDAQVDPGQDIDFGSKVNPWGSWDD